MAFSAIAARAAAGAANASCPSFPELDSTYELGSKLGRGCFATVYKATRRTDGAAVAVKAVEKKRMDVDAAKLLQNELEVLQVVSEHPGIVTLLDSVETDRYMFFVMEYVDGGPLLDRIVSRGNFSENDARMLLRAILQTLDYLAHLGCVHRDIKPENILVDNYSKKWPVKVTDFGLSAKMQPDELLYGTLGTPLFVAPEILKGEGYDCACDMWSLGVVLYLVLCGYPPFPYDNPQGLVTAIIHGQYSFPAPEWDHVSNDAKDALTRMMEVDPKRRITPSEALKHPWFRAAQSTSDLPNSKLKSFNARRKLKASMFAVRTTFDLMRFLDKTRPSSHGEEPYSQEELLQAVEKSRKLIQKMGITENGTPGSDSDNLPRERGEPEIPRLLSRRSLVLPSSIFESVPPDASNVSNTTEGRRLGESSSRGFAFQTSDTIPWNSQVMSSKAKALVAEVKDIPVLEDSENPFLVPVQKSNDRECHMKLQSPQSERQGQPSESAKSNAVKPLNEQDFTSSPQVSSESEKCEEVEGRRKPRPIVQLDLGGLGML